MATFVIDKNNDLWGCGRLQIFGMEDFRYFVTIPSVKFVSISSEDDVVVGICEEGFLWACSRIFPDGVVGFVRISDKKFVKVVCNVKSIHAIDACGGLWVADFLHMSKNKVITFRIKLKPLLTYKCLSISSGSFYTSLIDEAGNLKIFGLDSLYQWQFGNNVDLFQKVSDKKFLVTSCGDHYAMGIDEEGCLWGCGSNEDGQLGLGDYQDRNKLEKISDDKKFVDVRCGNVHTVVIDEDGFLWGCGSNNHGQLGIRACRQQNYLVKLSDEIFKSVSCFDLYTIALDINDSLWGSGSNYLGQLGVGDTESRNEFVKIDFKGIPTMLVNDEIKKKGMNTKGAHTG